tara:strand:- start:180 stop:1502 length:1323 start_codon:yes stop_codon:yes gene_type:complete
MNSKIILNKIVNFINENYLNYILLTILFISLQTVLSPLLSLFLSDEIELSPINFIQDIYISKKIIIIFILTTFPLLLIYYFFNSYNFNKLKNNFSYLNIFKISLLIFISIIIYKVTRFFLYQNLGIFYLIKSHYLYILLFSSSLIMYFESNKKIYLLLSILIFFQFLLLSNGNRANLITMVFIIMYFNSKFLNKHFLINSLTVLLFLIFILPINYSLKCRSENGNCFKNIFYDMKNFKNIYEDQYNRCLIKEKEYCLINTIGKLYSDTTIARVVQLHNINKVIYTEDKKIREKFENNKNIISDTLEVNPFFNKIFKMFNLKNLSSNIQLSGNEIGRMLNIISLKDRTTGIAIPTFIDLYEKFGYYSVIFFSFLVGVLLLIFKNSLNHNLLFFFSPFFFVKTIHSMENYFVSFLSNIIDLTILFFIFYIILSIMNKFSKNE